MSENERIIDELEDSLLTMGVLRTRLELIRHKLIKGITNPKTRVVSFDIDAIDAALLGLRSQEKLVNSFLVEYKARQD